MGGKKEKVFELILEIGHKSTLLQKKLLNGYTHKWTVFVKGHNNSKIEHCIQRIVFELHDSFDNPRRDISEPPFQIKETGYAGFEIPIHVYFKNRDKPNQVNFVHDLCLLANKANESNRIERIKFINPNKEFEKCLIKSGAQLLPAAIKKDRSSSPPAKKQKSSSLIPSKDMNNKQSQPQQQVQTQLQSSHANHHHHHHNHQSKSSHSGQNHHTSNHQTKSQSKHHHHRSDHQHHQQTALHKPKSSSKEFIDVFGAPLVYNSNNPKPEKEAFREVHKASVKQELPPAAPHVAPPPPPPQSVPIPSPIPAKVPPAAPPVAPPATLPTAIPATSKEEPPVNELQLLQSKISCLSDCDRLQKIVDIIEEAGEWYNLTSKKFEFDLKRLDKRTIHKIEKSLRH